MRLAVTSFQASPDEIEKCGDLLSRAGRAADEAQKYVRRFEPDFGGFSGKIFGMVHQSHDAGIEATQRMLDHLSRIAIESAKGLKSTANYYRHTERSVAARVDATYPKASTKLSHRELTASRYEELTGRPLATHNFADVIDAQAALKEPESAELGALEKFAMNPGSAFDYLSPSNAASQIIQLVIHHDPIEWLTEWFDGDWKGCYEFGDILENVGAMMEAISTNILQGASELRETWFGNASDAAWQYFDGLSTAVGEQQELLAQLGHKYKIIAMGILRMQETAAGIVKGMIDAALIGAAATSAGVATSETGVGGLIGGLVAGVEAARIWEMWERLKMFPENATQAGNSFIGFLQTATSTMTHFAQHPLPAHGYRSPVS